MMETFSCAGRDRITLEVFHGYGHVGDLRSLTDMLASAVEAMALDDSVHCLMFMLWPDVMREPFERRGYRAVVLDTHLAWLQKTLDQGSGIHVSSRHLH